MPPAAFESGCDPLSDFQETFRRYFGPGPTGTEASTLVRVDRFVTPLGPMLIAADDTRLGLLEFVDRRRLPNQVKRLRTRLNAAFEPGRNDLIAQTELEIGEYFAGKRRDFEIPLVAPGTRFQETVWEALTRIPYGETMSYGALATAVGRPGAVRAVGTSSGLNALAIVVPCHRVVGADGKLVGYAGGLWRKKRLLELEEIVVSGKPVA